MPKHESKHASDTTVARANRRLALWHKPRARIYDTNRRHPRAHTLAQTNGSHFYASKPMPTLMRGTHGKSSFMRPKHVETSLMRPKHVETLRMHPKHVETSHIRAKHAET